MDLNSLYLIYNKGKRIFYHDTCAAFVQNYYNFTFYIAKEIENKSKYKIDTYLNLIKELKLPVSIKIQEVVNTDIRSNHTLSSASNTYYKINIKSDVYKQVYYAFTIFRRMYYFSQSFNRVLESSLTDDFKKLNLIDKFNFISKIDTTTGNTITNGSFALNLYMGDRWNQSTATYDVLPTIEDFNLEDIKTRLNIKELSLEKLKEFFIAGIVYPFKRINDFGIRFNNYFTVELNGKTYLTVRKGNKYCNFQDNYYYKHNEEIYYVKDGIVYKPNEKGFPKKPYKRIYQRMYKHYDYGVNGLVFDLEGNNCAPSLEILLKIYPNYFVCVDW